jgi:hypothetical protein
MSAAAEMNTGAIRVALQCEAMHASWREKGLRVVEFLMMDYGVYLIFPWRKFDSVLATTFMEHFTRSFVCIKECTCSHLMED